MQIMIDIPNEAYNEIVNNVVVSHRKFSSYEMDNCIKNGITLQKGHGRLIDFDEINFDRSDFETYNDYSFTFDLLDYAPIIIEADKTESEG